MVCVIGEDALKTTCLIAVFDAHVNAALYTECSDSSAPDIFPRRDNGGLLCVLDSDSYYWLS